MLIPSESWGEDIAVDSSLVKSNLSKIKQQIAHYNVKIIAVTKYFGIKAIEAGYKAGLRDFAESRALEGIEKINKLSDEVRNNSIFHFIGHLQTNKADKVVKNFDIIHSVDSFKIATAISKSACSLNKREKVLLQVNNAEEEQKYGYSKVRLKEEISEILSLDGIEIIGLMNMAPFGASDEVLDDLFKDMRVYRDELEREFNIRLPELSMGMSDDYEFAVKNGSTMIRIGRKLFT